MIATLLVVALFLQEPSMDELIRRLSDEAPEARERTGRMILDRWKDWSAADLKKLGDAATGTDPETAARAGEVGRRIALRRELGAEVVGALERAENVVTRGTPAEKSELAGEIGRRVREEGLKNVAGALRLLLRDPTTQVRCAVLDAIGRAPVREMAGDLLASLKDKDLDRGTDATTDVGAHAVEALFKLGASDLIPDYLALLQAEEPVVQRRGIDALVKFQATRAVPDIVRLLDDPAPRIQTAALFALGRFGAKEHADRMKAFLKSGDETTRAVAAQVLAPWQGRLTAVFAAGKAVFRKGEDITVSFELSNVGDIPVSWMNGGANRNKTGRDDNFTFEVLLDGKPQEDVGAGPCFGGLGSIGTLDPGGKTVLKVDLRKWGAFDRAGTYEVRCKRLLRLVSSAGAPWGVSENWKDDFAQTLKVVIEE